MSTYKYLLAVSLFCVVACSKPAHQPATDTAAQPDSLYEAQARQITQQAFAALSGVLMREIAAGGPARAVEVCHKAALPLTDSLARAGGVQLRRTSSRPRNPHNAPDSLERRALAELAVQPLDANGRPRAWLHRSSEAVDVLLPIRLAMPTCLNCHGQPSTDIAPATLARLDSLYPEDAARGYALGDLRGAWHVRFPLR